jgi:hypothetical protein
MQSSSQTVDVNLPNTSGCGGGGPSGIINNVNNNDDNTCVSGVVVGPRKKKQELEPTWEWDITCPPNHKPYKRPCTDVSGLNPVTGDSLGHNITLIKVVYKFLKDFFRRYKTKQINMLKRQCILINLAHQVVVF